MKNFLREIFSSETEISSKTFLTLFNRSFEESRVFVIDPSEKLTLGEVAKNNKESGVIPFYKTRMFEFGEFEFVELNNSEFKVVVPDISDLTLTSKDYDYKIFIDENLIEEVFEEDLTNLFNMYMGISIKLNDNFSVGFGITVPV